jgi:hypothetical protein
MLYEVYIASGYGRVKSVRAVQGEVISPVARPVIVCHEKSFVDLTKDFWTNDLSIRSLKLMYDLSGMKWRTSPLSTKRVLHVGTREAAIGRG